MSELPRNPGRSGRDPAPWIALFLVLAPLVVFGSLRHAEFVNFDDHAYVYENPHVVSGLSAENVRWAFTTTRQGNWHPLTWISHMIDCELFGLEAGFHHLANLALHVVNSLLLFALLRRMTGRPWPSGFVAAVFALHPLHVESVAWVSERKDVLSASFWMLSIWAYARWVERPRTGRYLGLLVAYVLGLLSKPMVVTLPFALLLLDFWPLGRLAVGPGPGPGPGVPRRILGRVFEKLPMFALAGAVSAVTFVVQAGEGNVKTLARFSLDERVANAIVAYALYLGRAFWPFRLAVYYPHPGLHPVWAVGGSLLLLAGITWLVVRSARSAPFLLVGWLWFLGTLVPVIGLVQVGTQAIADRYMYLPLIGLAIMVAWGAPRLARRNVDRRLPFVAAVLVLAVLATATWRQVRYWRSSVVLFEHALEITGPNITALMTLATAHAARGEVEPAIRRNEEILEIDPRHPAAHYELGVLFRGRGETARAIDHYRAALNADPDNGRAHHNLGILLAEEGKIEEAIFHFEQALRIIPDTPPTRQALEQLRGQQP